MARPTTRFIKTMLITTKKAAKSTFEKYAECYNQERGKIQICNCAKCKFSTVQNTNMQVCNYAKYQDQERGKEHLCHPVGGRVVNHKVDKVKLPQKHCQHLNLTILEIPELEKEFVASLESSLQKIVLLFKIKATQRHATQA